MMFEAMMDLVWFFAGLFAVLALAFLGLRKFGVSSKRIERGVVQVARAAGGVPGVRYLVAFSRRHRKAVGWVGTILVICFAPFALVGVVVVVGSVVAIYAFGYLSQSVGIFDAEEEGSVSFDGETDEERESRWTDEDMGLYDGDIWSP